jgi:hypothetical protein
MSYGMMPYIVNAMLGLTVILLCIANMLSNRSTHRIRNQLNRSTEALSTLSDAHTKYKAAMEGSIAAHERYEQSLLERINLLEEIKVSPPMAG